MAFQRYAMGACLAAMALQCFAADTDRKQAAGASNFGKILFLGNSITWHGPKKDIGWSGNWGMAASAEEKDYAHIVAEGLSRNGAPPPVILIRNIAEFERNPTGYDMDARMADALAFKADLIILAIGENVPEPKTAEAKAAFRDGLRKLLHKLTADRQPTLVLRGCFWPNKVKDEILKQVCGEMKGIFVDIGHLSKDEANYARSERQFEHKGVAAHPGDRGMRAIADAILGALGRSK